MQCKMWACQMHGCFEACCLLEMHIISRGQGMCIICTDLQCSILGHASIHGRLWSQQQCPSHHWHHRSCWWGRQLPSLVHQWQWGQC